MGVKTLWTVLEPVKKPTPAKELRGQTIAVDLSAWVCESLAAVKTPRPHLRTLFYRIVNLSRLDIKLVFVIEGRAPSVKWHTMANRPAIPRTDGRPRERKSHAPRMDRSYFKAYLDECCELLDHMGIAYLQSAGEAEALCARLNKEGFVDGIFTEDGDAFLYGGRTVYKNLVASAKDSTVDVYKMDQIEAALGLNQNKLVGMSLLIGCDYLPGVPGIGKEKALQLMESFGNIDVLERFRTWTKSHIEDQSQTRDIYEYVSGHEGTPKRKKQKQAKPKPTLEEKIKSKAVQIPNFPDQDVIDEFLLPKEDMPTKPFQWSTPKLESLMLFLESTLKWSHEKTVEKTLPMITSLEMRALIDGSKTLNELVVRPVEILKTCRRHWVLCFQVQWLVPEFSGFKTEVLQTVESSELFRAAYPDITKLYNDRIEAERALKEATKRSPKKSAKPTTIKNSQILQMIRNAIVELKEPNGSHVKDIERYVKSVSRVSSKDVRKGLDTGKRSGALKECAKGRYQISRSAVMMDMMIKKSSVEAETGKVGSRKRCAAYQACADGFVDLTNEDDDDGDEDDDDDDNKEKKEEDVAKAIPNIAHGSTSEQKKITDLFKIKKKVALHPQEHKSIPASPQPLKDLPF